jgi:hypothetical protein
VLDAFLLASAILGSQPQGPIAPAQLGRIACIKPDPERRSCETISRYSVGDGGSFEVLSEALLDQQTVDDPSLNVIWTYRTRGWVEGDVVCERIALESFDNATFTSGGAPLGPAQRARLVDRLKSIWRPYAGRSLCFTYMPDWPDDGRHYYTASQGRIDKMPLPGTSFRIRWVQPGDGYRVWDRHQRP